MVLFFPKTGDRPYPASLAATSATLCRCLEQQLDHELQEALWSEGPTHGVAGAGAVHGGDRHGGCGVWDGVGPGAQRAERLRLIIEGPWGGRPSGLAFPSGGVPKRVIPYKLFEVVEGAVLEARGTQGTELEARVQIITSLGRRFRYRALARADREGWVRLRVPYATETTQPTKGRRGFSRSYKGTGRS